MQETMADLSPTHLDLHKPMSLSEWEALGERICKQQTVSGWLLGDWWLARRNIDTKGIRLSLRHTLKRFGISYKRLRNLGYLAEQYPPAYRIESLSIKHHEIALVLAPPLRYQVLLEAARQHWDTSELTRYIREFALHEAVEYYRLVDDEPDEPVVFVENRFEHRRYPRVALVCENQRYWFWDPCYRMDINELRALSEVIQRVIATASLS